MAQVIITPRARRDVDEAISALNLPGDTWTRIARSLRALETFPPAGPELAGRWTLAPFVLGPWPWMIMLYRYEDILLALETGRDLGVPLASFRAADEALSTVSELGYEHRDIAALFQALARNKPARPSLAAEDADAGRLSSSVDAVNGE